MSGLSSGSSSSSSGSSSSSSSSSSLMSKPFSYIPSSNPAVHIAQAIGAATRIPSLPTSMFPTVNTSDPAYQAAFKAQYPIPQNLTPSQIEHHNFTIQRLENDWIELYAKTYEEKRGLTEEEEKRLNEILVAIENSLKGWKGTSSTPLGSTGKTYYQEMVNVMNGFIMDEELEKLIKAKISKNRTKGGSKRKSTRKQKKSKKYKKSKKSHRRHHSKSK